MQQNIISHYSKEKVMFVNFVNRSGDTRWYTMWLYHIMHSANVIYFIIYSANMIQCTKQGKVCSEIYWLQFRAFDFNDSIVLQGVGNILEIEFMNRTNKDCFMPAIKLASYCGARCGRTTLSHHLPKHKPGILWIIWWNSFDWVLVKKHFKILTNTLCNMDKYRN